MCGIAGIFGLNGQCQVSSEILKKMNQSQIHRGPDEGGVFLGPGVGLAHRRLSIIDLSSGQQPMQSADGDFCVVFNGEIYNFPQLTDQLQSKGYKFQTRSDTEVILYAWQEWGEKCVEHFRGMFAFALFDRNRQSLFLARDRLGIKPLFYALLPNNIFIFASELKALKMHPDLPKTLDPQAVEDYFCLGYIPEPKSIFSAVCKLKPGHTLLLEKGDSQAVQKQYWDLPFIQVAITSESALVEELVERIREAVQIRLVSEVPLGAFLSGGVDSSTVVSMMAQLQRDPVNTCAIGFDVRAFDETQYASMVAARYQTKHYEKVVGSDDFDLLDTLASLYDEPYADSSAIPTYRVCQLARERVTVALSGDGGDENFAGYRRYRWHMNEERIRSALPLGLRKPVFAAMGAVYPKADWAPRLFRAKSTLQSLAKNSVEAYLHSVSITKEDQRKGLFSAELKRALQGYRAIETFIELANNAPREDPLALIQYIDMKTYLAGDILTKVDRASMAHSLEVRVPLLDHNLVEWVSGLPSGLKLRGQEGKYILKKAFERHLPREVLYRKKMGFGVPLANWFRGPLKERLRSDISEGGLAETGLFDQQYLDQLVGQHQSGVRDHSAVLWSLLMFQATTKHDNLCLGH